MLPDIHNRLTFVRWEGVGGPGEKGERIKQTNKTVIDTDNSMMLPEGKGVGAGRRDGKMVMERDLT